MSIHWTYYYVMINNKLRFWILLYTRINFLSDIFYIYFQLSKPAGSESGGGGGGGGGEASAASHDLVKLVAENENLRGQVTDLGKELSLAKKRRDWAFVERDKILRERDSIRSFCDELRHQRDKAISELAESLRESDELRKQKTMTIKQIQMLE